MSPRSRDPKPRTGEHLPLLLMPPGASAAQPLCAAGTLAEWGRATAPLHVGGAFGREAPLEVDIGCGKGRFLLAHARAFPGVNFLGVDRMIERLRKIDRRAHRETIGNVRLLHAEASHVILRLLPPSSVHTFYIFFPDPWPKRRHRERRLMGDATLTGLARALAPGGHLHFATDHEDYFMETAKRLRACPWFSEIEPFVPTDEERTDFELLFAGQGCTIGRCSFKKRADPPQGQ